MADDDNSAFHPLPILHAPVESPRSRTPWLVRGYRLIALAVAAWLIWVAHERTPVAEADAVVSLAEARRLFPQAARLGRKDQRRRGQVVLSADGRPLGLVLKTSPETDDLIGYAGPSNLLVGLGPEGRVVRVELLWSRDTTAHVDEVRRATDFWTQFVGWQPSEKSSTHIEAVSGSTLTSLAMAEGVQRRLSGEALSLRFPLPVALEEVQAVFPDAVALAVNDPRAGWQRAMDANGRTLGYVVRTSPAAESVIGYGGPTEALLAINVDQQTVTAVRLRTSYDTPEYVDRVRADDGYLRQLAHRTIAEWAAIDFRAAGIEGVSGATQTSFAVAEGIRRRLQADLAAAEKPAVANAWWKRRDVGLLAVVLGSLLVTFTPLKGRRGVRWVWQAILIAGFGLWFGDLLSLALLAGWSRHGVPWSSSPALVLLVAVSLLVPWGTKRQIYCHHLCPHGAAQEWLGRWGRLHVHLPARWSRTLGILPALLLGVAFLLAMTVPSFDLAPLEPFDAWVLRGAAAVSLALAAVGLAASVFVPQAYCRFGCPTGALLKFVRSHGSNEGWGLRDTAALAVLLIGAACVFLRPSGDGVASTTESSQLSGAAFGTTWSIKLRQSVMSPALHDEVAAELERIESRLSHWRPESETSQFNASATTLELEYSAELLSLVQRAQELSAATEGAFDITVGPLVDLWGYGPSGPRTDEPTAAEITQRLPAVGWRKLHVDRQWNTLRKDHPELQIDLGSLLQGYAVDRVAGVLDAAGVTQYLIEIGGELRARGSWPVAIENPRDPARPLRTLVLTDAALSTSGTYRRAANGELQTRHILSPSTGRPLNSSWTLCAVIAKTGLDADGWDTALLASDPSQTLEIAHRADVAAILVDASGREVLSDAARRLSSP